MKKLILFLVPLLLIQSVAFADTATGLKALIDDYRFNVTVDWDQKDEAALEQIQARFRQDLNALQSTQKITVADIKEAINTHDVEINTVLNQTDEAALAEELQKLIDSRSEDMYARGTSWSPGAVFFSGLGILLVLEIIVLAMKDSDCPNTLAYPEGVRYDCEWSN